MIKTAVLSFLQIITKCITDFYSSSVYAIVSPAFPMVTPHPNICPTILFYLKRLLSPVSTHNMATPGFCDIIDRIEVRK